MRTGAEAPIGVLVLSNCSVVVWCAPRRAFGAITGYEVKFFIPNTSQNKVTSKDRDVFYVKKEGKTTWIEKMWQEYWTE